MKYEITVQLKKEVLDPEGRAIHETMDRLGFNTLKDVTVRKSYVLELDPSEKNPDTVIEEIAKEYLSNPVAETYSIERL